LNLTMAQRLSYTWSTRFQVVDEAMQLAETRYTHIEGTEVIVKVQSAEEARLAIRELKHRKKELGFLKRSLARQLKRATPRKGGRRSKRSFAGMLWAGTVWVLDAMMRLAGRFKEGPRIKSTAELGREIARIDETLHNVDSCIIQVEGKLLNT
jgi:hypothetical protein